MRITCCYLGSLFLILVKGDIYDPAQLIYGRKAGHLLVLDFDISRQVPHGAASCTLILPGYAFDCPDQAFTCRRPLSDLGELS